MFAQRPSIFLWAIAVAGFVTLAPVRMLAQAAQQQQSGAAPQRNWKDRTEYDLYQAAATGKDPKANLAKLDEWKTKYPQTEFADQRRVLYLTNYVQANDIKDAVAAAKDIIANDKTTNPKGYFQALYYLTLFTPALGAGSATVPPDVLDQGEKAANEMLADLDKEKPEKMSDADWNNQKKPIEAIAHTTLGWVAWQRKDYDKAENEFKQSLMLNPGNNAVDYWLGSVEIAEKKPEKYPEALFYVARAASYDGQGSDAATRQAATQFFDKAYAQYHGSADGADQVKQVAKNNAVPPSDFKIVSTVDLEKAKIEAENKAAQEHPELALYKSIKDALTGADGQTYFNEKMKDSKLPTLKGKVISMEPASRPKTVVLGILDPNTPDVTLTFDMPLPGKVEPGTELSFEGVPTSYTASPFMVTFMVDKDDLHGWTGKNEPVRGRGRRAAKE